MTFLLVVTWSHVHHISKEASQCILLPHAVIPISFISQILKNWIGSTQYDRNLILDCNDCNTFALSNVEIEPLCLQCYRWQLYMLVYSFKNTATFYT